MSKKRSFIQLTESYMRRHQRGGFLVGDVIVFDKGYKSKSGFKELSQNTRDELQSMIDSGLNIRVINIKDANPGPRYPGNSDTTSGEVVLDVAVDEGGGRYGSPITIPVDIGTPNEDLYPNLPPIPDAWRRKDKVNIKPQELEEDQESLTNKTDRGDGKLKQTEIKNPVKNTKIPSKAANSTANYMKGIK